MLIAFGGLAGAGKDTAAKLTGLEVRHFMDPGRASLLALNPWVWDPHGIGYVALADLVKQLGWERAKRESHDVRGLLQRMGTEAGRSVHGEDCWVRLADLTGAAAFADTRFRNEVDAVWERGGNFVWVDRPGVEQLSHTSERQLGPELADYVLRNDGTLEDLAEEVKTMLEVLGL